MTLEEIEQLGHKVDQQHRPHKGRQVFTGTLAELTLRIRTHEEHVARREAEQEKARTAEDHRMIDRCLGALAQMYREVERESEYHARRKEETEANDNITPVSLRLESDRVHRRFRRASEEALAHLERVKKLPHESLTSHERLTKLLERAT
jgi:hypothetical protein